MGCPDLAWDAVQETLVSLWQTETMPPEPRPWLFRTVIHRCLHMRRTRQRRSHYEAAACAACDDAEAAGGVTAIERERLATLLQQAIGTLPPEQRTIFIMRELEHADYEAIAHRVGVPVGTVRSRLHRARAALRAWLLQVGTPLALAIVAAGLLVAPTIART
jgi:RNA polymerase sigma-70 factor (ECF subfamily)